MKLPPFPQRLRIKHLLLITNAFILVLALLGLVFFRLWDGHLVRVTEQRLIAESVLVAEALRHELKGAGVEVTTAFATPRLELNYDVVERQKPVFPSEEVPATKPQLASAVAALADFLEDARTRDLSFTQILDASGCRAEAARKRKCLDSQPEVLRALGGEYAAVARALPESAPWWAWNVAVATALPILGSDGVTAVVHMARNSFSPFEVVWNLRWTVLLGTLACLAFTFALTHFFSRVISRPVSALTESAKWISRGEPRRPFTPDRFAPAEVHELAGALDQMTQKLTERAEYIAGFAANASHELKTPLTGIRGAVELLQEDWDSMPTEQRDRFLQNIDSDAERMQRLVSRLLELARIESSTDEVDQTPLRETIEEICNGFGEQVRIDVSQAPPTIAMSREHLETAVRNLVDNAVRHSGGKPVDLRVWHDGTRVQIAVSDRGHGISAGNLGRIFDRFFTTDRDNGGTGLGLAIVKAIADLRGGEIAVVSNSNGTTFTLAV